VAPSEEIDEELHLEMHRAADSLGKFATKMQIHVKKGMGPEDAKRFEDKLLLTVAADLFQNGADLIGHIKSFLHAPTGTLMASLVDTRIGVQLTSGLEHQKFQEAEVTLHVIVHGLWDPDVRDVSNKSIEKVCHEMGIEYEVLQDYFETEKSIAHHQTK
jgi:hypothetical protein